MWAANALDGTVSRIDATGGQVVQTAGAGSQPTEVTAGLGAVWVTDQVGRAVYRIDPASGRVTQTIGLDRHGAAHAQTRVHHDGKGTSDLRESRADSADLCERRRTLWLACSFMPPALAGRRRSGKANRRGDQSGSPRNARSTASMPFTAAASRRPSSR